MKVVTLGTFDILHAGHIKLLKFCKELGEVVVGLNTDDFVLKFKGKKPIMSYEERRETLKEFGIDMILSNTQEGGDAKGVILASGASFIVVGSDWATKDYIGQIGVTWEWLEENNIGICYFPRSLPMSTTIIKERVKNG